MRDVPYHKKTEETDDQSSILAELYRRYGLEICRYIGKTFGAGPPEPEDVMQTTFVKFAALDDPEIVKNPRAYLYRTAHNVVVDERRRLIRQNRYAASEMKGSAEKSDDLSPEHVLLAKDRLGLIATVVKTMPVKYRRSFLLNRMHGLSCAEIARRTGYSESAIKKHVSLALADIDVALTAAECVKGNGS